ncbi:MAG: discoidin domain-containing protein [Clostridiales bacterium]|nr:discoidin domain-containing protein [Clostridiales bacterium]
MQKKKILSTIIVIAMIVTLVPAIASAQITEVKQAPSYSAQLHDWKISPSVPGTTLDAKYGLKGGDDADISEPDYDTADWIDAVAPSTVLGNLLDAGAYDDLFMNLTGTTDEWFNGQFNAVPSSDFAQRWWYSTDFTIPVSEAGKRVTLSIGGITYHADMYINGVLVKNNYNHITNPQDLWNGPLVDNGPYTAWADATGSNSAGTWAANYAQQGLEAYAGEIAGSFRRFDIDITDYVHADGKPNNVKFKILKAYSQQDLTYHWVDWHPRPNDSMMGLTGEVHVSTSGPVRLNNPAVATKVTEDLSSASVNLYCAATNLTGSDITGTVSAVIKDPAGNTVATVSKSATVKSKLYNQEIAFKSKDFPALTLDDPQLWWPYMSGDQPLYTVDWSFAIEGTVSDALTHRAGLRQVDVDINVTPYFAQNAATITPGAGSNMITFYFNHKPVMLRGGGYCPTDLFLRHDPVQNQGVIDNVKYSGFNMIRDEGKFFDNDLLDLCDENGIVVFTGWCCCDRHQSPNNWTKCERFLGYEEQYAQTNNLRQHASGVLWYNGSDQAASFSQSSLSNSWMVEEMYHVIEAKLRWDEIGITATSACLDPSRLLGSMNTGFHMDAGYNSQSHSYWLNPLEYRGIWGFVSEGAGGAGIPAIETMKRVIPAGNLWPYNDSVAANNGTTFPTTSNYTAWNRLCAQRDNVGGGNYSSLNQYSSLLDNSYGASSNLESWHAKAMSQQLDQYRGQYESLDQHRYTNITGLVNWMLNGAKPSIYWQQFDFYMNPTSATFGAARANEPVHIMYNQLEHLVSVVNNTFDEYPDMTATMEIYNLDGKLISTPLVQKLNVAPDSVGDTTVYGDMANYVPTGQLAKWAVKQPDGRWGFRNGWHYDDETDTFTPMLYNYFGQIKDAYGVNYLWDYDTIEASFTEAASDVYFIRLQLADSTGKVVSYNNYAVPMRSGWEAHGQSVGPIHQGYDYTPLNSLKAIPASELTCVQTGSATAGGIVTQTLEIANNSDVVAHNVYLASYTDNTYKDLIGAVQYSDNLFILFPGETRTITVTHRDSNLKGDAFINMTCYNNQIGGDKPVRFKNRYTGLGFGLGRSLSIGKPVTVSGGTTGANITTIAAAQISQTANPGGAIQHKTFIDSYLNSACSLPITGGSAWFSINLGAPMSFDELMLHFNVSSTIRNRPDRIVIEGSNDNATWTELARADTNGSVMVDVILPQTAKYQYVKVTLNGSVANITTFNVSGCDIYAFNNYANVIISGDGTVVGDGKSITKDSTVNQRVVAVPPGGSTELTFAPDALSPMVRVLADGVDISDQLVDKGDTKVLALSGLSGDVDLDVYFGIQAFLTTDNVTYINDDAEYTLSLMNAKDVLAVEAEFTIDGSMLAGKGLVGLNGFDSMNGVLWLHAGDNLWKGAVTLALPSGNSTGLTTDAPVDIAKFTYTAKGYGNAAMTLTSARVVFLDGTTKYIGSKIENGTATTIVARSKYDLNRDGVVDALDLGIMLLYCGFDADSPNWGTMVKVNDAWGNPVTAKMCDVNADGMIDMLDLLDLFIHYTK